MCQENFWKDSKVTGVITSERIDWMGQERDFFSISIYLFPYCLHFKKTMSILKCLLKKSITFNSS